MGRRIRNITLLFSGRYISIEEIDGDVTGRELLETFFIEQLGLSVGTRLIDGSLIRGLTQQIIPLHHTFDDEGIKDDETITITGSLELEHTVGINSLEFESTEDTRSEIFQDTPNDHNKDIQTIKQPINHLLGQSKGLFQTEGQNNKGSLELPEEIAQLQNQFGLAVDDLITQSQTLLPLTSEIVQDEQAEGLIANYA